MKHTTFGTDGIRGPANQGPLAPMAATRLGLAIAWAMKKNDLPLSVYIGRDTRRSGRMLEAALAAGLMAGGVNVGLLGVLPTPAVGFLTREDAAALGLMITASHNPSSDNGIKLFDGAGYKISDGLQEEIEAALAGDLTAAHAPVDEIGETTSINGASERYLAFVRSSLGEGGDFSGLKIVFDGANGAAAHLGAPLLRTLGATVIEIGAEPDGQNINDGVGSTAPASLAHAVQSHGADVGLALDGDGDRILLIDEGGHEIDGDQILAVLARRMAKGNALKTGRVVATIMSNLGLETFLADEGLALERTAVGDRHVVAQMRQSGASLGGESSGHIVLGDYATTGDGLLAGLHLLAALCDLGGPASETLRAFDPAPQVLINVAYPSDDPTGRPAIAGAIKAAEARLDGAGRVLIRKSGTEPVIRVMVEAADADICAREAETLADIIRSEAGRPFTH